MEQPMQPPPVVWMLCGERSTYDGTPETRYTAVDREDTAERTCHGCRHQLGNIGDCPGPVKYERKD